MLISSEKCRKLTDAGIIQKSLEELDYFSCLYDRYEEKMLSYIMRLSSLSRFEAEDILQEAFIKVWKNLNGIDTTMPLSSWLYRLVHNETISYLRKSKSYGKNNTIEFEKIALADEAEEQLFDESNVENDPVGFSNSILNKMALKYREVLVLKFIEKLSYEEISDVLKIPEGTVAVRINRAKQAFKKLASNDISKVTF
jgi:RNA polymerase sigma-70 factor (ECF subfamily)